MSADKIIAGLQDAVAGRTGRVTTVHVSADPELSRDLASFGVSYERADGDSDRRRTFRTRDGTIGQLSVAEALNLARLLNRVAIESAALAGMQAKEAR